MATAVPWDAIQKRIWSCEACKGHERVQINVRQQTPAPVMPAPLLFVGIAPPDQSSPAKGVPESSEPRCRPLQPDRVRRRTSVHAASAHRSLGRGRPAGCSEAPGGHSTARSRRVQDVRETTGVVAEGHSLQAWQRGGCLAPSSLCALSGCEENSCRDHPRGGTPRRPRQCGQLTSRSTGPLARIRLPRPVNAGVSPHRL